jgi:hypothetical protein
VPQSLTLKASLTMTVSHTARKKEAMTTKAKDIWQFLELPNRYAPAAQALYSWGLNCDRDGNPFLVYLDLIGWTAENGFTAFTSANSSYGYTEIGYLADALTEYADSPHEVTAWIDEVMSMEGV